MMQPKQRMVTQRVVSETKELRDACTVKDGGCVIFFFLNGSAKLF